MLQFAKFNVFNLYACTDATFGVMISLLPAKISVANAFASENSVPCNGFNAFSLKSM